MSGMPLREMSDSPLCTALCPSRSRDNDDGNGDWGGAMGQGEGSIVSSDGLSQLGERAFVLIFSGFPLKWLCTIQGDPSAR